jgi:glucoamylase
MVEPLEAWIDAQYRISAQGLLQSVSCGLTKTRRGFSQRVTARAGSVVASPVLADYDPEPDYFFHWFRDSALVIDALRLLRGEAHIGRDVARDFIDFLDFSLALNGLDGASLVTSGAWRTAVLPPFQQFLRTDADLSAVRGAAVVADTRVNPDATLDISNWARPQYDGAALRALTLLRWLRGELPDAARAAAETLLRSDLALIQARGRDACFDIWEEEKGFHYYTLRVAAAALLDGAHWLQGREEPDSAAPFKHSAEQILARLDGYWLESAGHYRSRVLENGQPSAKELDIAVILAALHSDARGESHSVFDPRMHATLEKLEQLFDAEYPLNRRRAAHEAPAMGRYAQDRYYSGGPYFFSTLGAAEFCYRAAAGAAQAQAWMRRGDAFLNTVRKFTPADGELPEQFDRDSGLPRSARRLAWSHAAFLSCVHARRLTGWRTPQSSATP